ncbi:hypothetical protein BDF14DRAFT_1827916 [Spinellus fusiger]|nr:hypothetical protein BDF14DRAFT_1827916 [Spinellus fusiger]
MTPRLMTHTLAPPPSPPLPTTTLKDRVDRFDREEREEREERENISTIAPTAPTAQAIKPHAVFSVPSELIIHILKHLTRPTDLLNCALAIRPWSYHAFELICMEYLCYTLNEQTKVHYPYASFIRRINLSALSEYVKDSHIHLLKSCEYLERVTLTGCHLLTDAGLVDLLSEKSSANIVSIDLSEITAITDTTILRIAQCCPRLQGLNLSMYREGTEQFHGVTDNSIVALANQCRGLRRIILNNCSLLTDDSITVLADKCTSLLEIDLMNCAITNVSLQKIFLQCQNLREFRLNNCMNVSNAGFLYTTLPPPSPFTKKIYYEQLRILDMTGISSLTDEAVTAIIDTAPKIRNLVLNKCYNITDASIYAICHLGRYLHFLHLGHCSLLTDRAITQLARHCTRIRYLDLACCSQLTDTSVIELATLQKLKRIGLVKCSNITDRGVNAIANHPRIANSLERVHLSYCAQLTVASILRLLNICHRLTHLSLTQVRAFLRPEFQQFCRKPPKDFTPQQRNAFCVFSGSGVHDFRDYLNTYHLRKMH